MNVIMCTIKQSSRIQQIFTFICLFIFQKYIKNFKMITIWIYHPVIFGTCFSKMKAVLLYKSYFFPLWKFETMSWKWRALQRDSFRRGTPAGTHSFMDKQTDPLYFLRYFSITDAAALTWFFHWKQWGLLIDFNGSLRDDAPLMTNREVFRIIIISIIAITPTLSLCEWEREEE